MRRPWPPQRPPVDSPVQTKTFEDSFFMAYFLQSSSHESFGEKCRCLLGGAIVEYVGVVEASIDCGNLLRSFKQLPRKRYARSKTRSVQQGLLVIYLFFRRCCFKSARTVATMPPRPGFRTRLGYSLFLHCQTFQSLKLESMIASFKSTRSQKSVSYANRV